MTAERADLARLRAVGERATSGLWEWEEDACSEDGLTYTPNRVWTDGGTDYWGEAQNDYVLGSNISNEDAEFIATARNEWDGLLDEIERLRGVVAGVEALVEEMEAEPYRANSYPGFSQGYDMRREEDAERLRDLLAAHGPHSDAAGAATGRTDALSDLIAECERDELWLVQQFEDGSQRGRRASWVLHGLMGGPCGGCGQEVPPCWVCVVRDDKTPEGIADLHPVVETRRCGARIADHPDPLPGPPDPPIWCGKADGHDGDCVTPDGRRLSEYARPVTPIVMGPPVVTYTCTTCRTPQDHKSPTPCATLAALERP